MEAFGALLVLGLVGLVLILPLVAIVKSGNTRREVDTLRAQVRDLLATVTTLKARFTSLEREGIIPRAPEPPPITAIPAPMPAASTIPAPEPAPEKIAFAEANRAARPALPPLVTSTISESAAAAPPVETAPPPAGATPPPLPPARVAKPVPAKAPALNLEQFMGVKLFAWLGGLALFFGIVFFVKYAVEHSWISPALRAAMGFLVGLVMLGAGISMHRKKAYTVLAETFIGTGVLILYGVTYAAHAYWKFPLFTPLVAFGIMTLVTAAAFFLSVRLHALSISVMGMVGGFLTPILCSTGEDNPWGLFGYIALLDIGLLAVARVRKWYFLVSLGALGTVLMQLSWFEAFFYRGHYFEGTATWTPILICAAFMVLFIIAAIRTKQDETGNLHPALSAMALCGSAMLFAFFFLGYSSITSRTWLLYGFVFFINAAVIAGVVINPRLGWAQLAVGLATFLHLACWTTQKLRPEALGSALAVYFIFGALHSVFPVLWQKLKPQNAMALQGAFSPWFPPLTLVLMLLPVLSLPETSFIVWPAILLVDALAIMVAVTTSLLLPVVAALILTLIVAGAWLFKVPVEIASVNPFLGVVGGFAAFFAIAGNWLSKRCSTAAEGRTGIRAGNDQVAAMLPVMSAALPFFLLIMASQRLPMPDPSPVFGLGLLLVILQLALAKISRLTSLPLVSLGCMFALEFTWHDPHFKIEAPWAPLLWYIGVYALFAVYPFVFRNAFREVVLPWATAALAAVLQFLLINGVIKDAFPALAGKMGLIPALFALPSILSLFGVLRGLESTGKIREGQLAWFGGVGLFFITMIFPIQFNHQWITLSWALEGAALLWLYQRVPHVGLRGTGLVLLAIVFVRLALNPEVLTYQPHSTVPILNWYLYTYGICAAAMFCGAWFLKEPTPRMLGLNARGLLWTAGGILLFWLLNIEIADFFTPATSRVTVIELWNVNLGRDMTYSIGWGIFALGLILLGFLLNTRGARYAGIGLLAITLLKVFFHDLSSLESIYRIGALIGVAVIALAASFLYQKFFEKTKTSPPA